MARDIDARAEYEAALTANATLSVRPVVELNLDVPFFSSDILSGCDSILRWAGAEQLFKERLMTDQGKFIEILQSGRIALNAYTCAPTDSRHPAERVVLTAAPLWRDEELLSEGFYTDVAHRVHGNSTHVVPLAVEPSIAYTANAVVSWHQAYSKDLMRGLRETGGGERVLTSVDPRKPAFVTFRNYSRPRRPRT